MYLIALTRWMIPFCRVIRPTNSTYGMSGSIPYSRSVATFGRRPVLVQIDPVVDHADPLGGDAVELVHVLLHRRRHRDDAVGVLIGRPLDPGGHLVRRPELLDLPRPVRLQRVRRQHQRHVLELLDEAAGEVGVPGVAMDDVDGASLPAMTRSCSMCREELRVPGIVGRQRHGREHAFDAQCARLHALFAEAEDVDGMTRRRRARRARASGIRRGRRRRRTRAADTRWSGCQSSPRQPPAVSTHLDHQRRSRKGAILASRLPQLGPGCVARDNEGA